METRAHFVIVGLFTILGILGGLGFFLWLGSVQIDRQYTQYGVLFDNVSGLDQSADVLFNGVGVGRVIGIRIWEDDPSKAFVAIEIDAATPVAVDTVARLESQGVTGVAYIALSGGSPGTALLTATPDEYPIIASRQSSLQSLVSNAPELLEEVSNIIGQIEALTGEINQAHVRRILENLETSSVGLEQSMSDFSEIAETLRTTTDRVSGALEGFEGLGEAAHATLGNVDTSLATINETFEAADATIDALGPAVSQANDAIAAINTFVEQDIVPLAGDVRNTLANADTALASADRAFARASDIMASDLGPAMAEIREALAGLADAVTSVTTDAPALMSELRAGVAEGRRAIAAAAPGMRDFGQLGGEARAVLRGMSDLIRRIGQDPSGFLLDDRVPEYRR